MKKYFCKNLYIDQLIFLFQNYSYIGIVFQSIPRFLSKAAPFISQYLQYISSLPFFVLSYQVLYLHKCQEFVEKTEREKTDELYSLSLCLSVTTFFLFRNVLLFLLFIVSISSISYRTKRLMENCIATVYISWVS